MLFNSLEFLIFLPLVFILYWFVFVKNLKLQNLLLLTSSYIFYGWWDKRFLILIVASSLIDYFVGLKIHSAGNKGRKRFFLLISVIANLGFLAFFKYFNFFIDSFIKAFSFLGYQHEPFSLKIILPVGISFYTFQTLSYSIDIYKGKLSPTKDIIAFFTFVGFFPQLVAGPIERAVDLLPQFYKKRSFSYKKASDGMRQILWGFFKKIVIADNCAAFANLIFDNYLDLKGSALLLGVIFFAFQIYGDFSGYSDIAIGTSRLFGLSLRQNFAFPYFSRDIAEFWRRWHISLSSWFRDYLYIPLGGSKGGNIQKIRNTLIIFSVSGLWHGAGWNYVFWGLLNALYFIPLIIFHKNRENLDIVAKGKILPSIKELTAIVFTFLLTSFAWIFFRSENLSQAFIYIKTVFSPGLFSTPAGFGGLKACITLFLVIFLLIIEWLGRNDQYAIEKNILKLNTISRYSFYYLLLSMIIFLSGKQQEFIYFQF